MEIDIVIDSLTNCLVCNKTGKELDTEFKEIIVDSVYLHYTLKTIKKYKELLLSST